LVLGNSEAFAQGADAGAGEQAHVAGLGLFDEEGGRDNERQPRERFFRASLASGRGPDLRLWLRRASCPRSLRRGLRAVLGGLRSRRRIWEGGSEAKRRFVGQW
jgi:hypothetical protein